MEELHSQGTKIEAIVAVLKTAPIHPRIIQAIKSAHALGYCLLFSLFVFSFWFSRYKNTQSFAGNGIINFRCDLKIVSDANVFFIDTILKHHGLRECFSEINTNPGFVDEEGRLRIFPHHDFTKSPHGCHYPCPPNMCKVYLLII